MYNSFLIFSFGNNEDAAQQARHKLEVWKQASRLDKKLLYKFDRGDGAVPSASEAESQETKPAKNEKPKSASKKTEKQPSASNHVKLLVRLYFSGHEKLTHQRWLDRIPSEEPFKQASPQILRSNDTEFSEVEARFESLE